MTDPSPGIERDHMDLWVRPCDDFFRYANGAWLDRTPIPADEPAGSVQQQVGDPYAKRAKSSPSSQSRYIGIATRVWLNGSGVGVMTAPSTKTSRNT